MSLICSTFVRLREVNSSEKAQHHGDRAHYVPKGYGKDQTTNSETAIALD